MTDYRLKEYKITINRHDNTCQMLLTVPAGNKDFKAWKWEIFFINLKKQNTLPEHTLILNRTQFYLYNL